jgi:hypothetical protein
MILTLVTTAASIAITGINFRAGGFRVTIGTQVINVFGELIGGLFTVGACTRVKPNEDRCRRRLTLH